MPIHSSPWSFQLVFHKNHPIIPLMPPPLSFQAFYYPKEAGLAFGGPGSSRYLRLEVHYHNPLLFKGEWGARRYPARHGRAGLVPGIVREQTPEPRSTLKHAGREDAQHLYLGGLLWDAPQFLCRVVMGDLSSEPTVIPKSTGRQHQPG